MKIQCNVCEAAEAVVLCCADEAALCLFCDKKVHAANKLATKHQRVSLSTSPSKMPKCDICQRFLLTGVRVGLEATEPGASTSSGNTRSSVKNSEPEMHSLLRKSAPVSSNAQCNKVLPTQVGGLADFMAAKSPMTGGISQWQLDEFLGI